jgi:hypothetical protein
VAGALEITRARARASIRLVARAALFWRLPYSRAGLAGFSGGGLGDMKARRVIWSDVHASVFSNMVVSGVIDYKFAVPS